MTTTNCQNCPSCAGTGGVWDATYSGHLSCDACNGTGVNRVDWHTIALTEKARADAAEAELRALREALPKWCPDGQDSWLLKFGDFIKPPEMVDFWAGNSCAELHKTHRLGRATTPDAARRLVEQHHGLPPCEVLP